MRSLKQRVFRAAVGLSVITSVLAPTAALAAGPSKEQCISANEDGAVLKKRGRFMAAQKSLAACSAESCPQMIRDDCTKGIQDLEKAIPTIRFQAMEGTTEIFDVRVLMDNEPLVEKLEGGKAIPVDPGEHLFSIFAKGHPTQTRKVVLKEGEKDHVERIDFGTAPISPTSAHLIVMTEPGAGIVVDGKGPLLGRYEGVLTPGGHEVRVAKDGKIPVLFNVDMKSGETQMNVTLQNDKPNYFPWIIGGAIVVAGLLIGGGIAIAVSK
ncbi:MAG: hypothetical protein U0270_31250 [Labilithrix sp.]